MDEEALLARLQALEKRNADQDRQEAFSAFMNAHGADFSNNEDFGNVLYDALISRVGPSASMEAQAAAYNEMLDSLEEDLSTVQKLLKRQARSTEDIIDQLGDEVDAAKKTADKMGGASQPEPTPQDNFVPPEGVDMNAEPDYMGEEFIPEQMGNAPMPPAPEAMPAPESAPAPEGAAPMDPSMTVSDRWLKNIKARLFKSKPVTGGK